MLYEVITAWTDRRLRGRRSCHAPRHCRGFGFAGGCRQPAARAVPGADQSNYEEILYEGYAPHGVAVIVEAATDNPIV